MVYDMICKKPKSSVNNIITKLDITRMIVLRDVQEIKKFMI